MGGGRWVVVASAADVAAFCAMPVFMRAREHLCMGKEEEEGVVVVVDDG